MKTRCIRCQSLVEVADSRDPAGAICHRCIAEKETAMAPGNRAVPTAQPKLQTPPGRKGSGGPAIICPNPNCGYRGPCQQKSRGSWVMLLFLLMLGVVPGLLYLAVAGGYRRLCPQCGMQISSDW